MTGEARTFRAHPRYTIFALVSLIMAGLLTWQLVQRWETATLLFVLIALGLALWSAHLILARVMLEGNRITYHRPPFPPRVVEFRQFINVYLEGRVGRSILVAYHPYSAQGLLDLEHAEALTLPALVDQTALFAELEQQVPA